MVFDRLNAWMPKAWRSTRVTIPLVRISGVIGGAMRFRPGVTMEALAGPLRQAFAVKGAPAVAIVINSPGGSPVQSNLIYRRIRALAAEKDKTVLVFVEDVAASGGYLIALAGDEIIVDPNSIVGSIGVVSAGFGFQRLIERIGVERRVHSAGERKAMLDPFQPERPEDVAHLEALQREVHAMFVGLVRARRGTKLAEATDLFSGAFWTGTRGIELGLVDRLGDLHSVLQERYGATVRLKPISGGRGLFQRLRPIGMASALAGASADAIMLAAEERALRSRFGL